VFSAGSLAAAFSSTLTLMLIARFIAGMGHGLFLAVASSTAARRPPLGRRDARRRVQPCPQPIRTYAAIYPDGLCS